MRFLAAAGQQVFAVPALKMDDQIFALATMEHLWDNLLYRDPFIFYVCAEIEKIEN